MTTKTLTVTYRDGTLTLPEPIDIPNGSQVQITIEAVEHEPKGELSAWDKQIRQESEAFIRQHAGLLKQYEGQFVAIHNGAVIDHDGDKRTLFHRVRAQWRDMPILIREVNKVPIREVTIRSPRLER